MKINYGLRYDLYRIPEADRTAPLAISRKFNVDKNNFAPRLGVVYAWRGETRPTVLRAGAGIYYETPWLNMYERALLNNGNPRFFNFSFNGANGPAFPFTFSGSLPVGAPLPSPDIDTIAPDFENMYAIHTHLQIEQAITNNLSFAVGFNHSGGRQIAVYRNINLIPLDYLADGRPVFGRSVSALTRYNPQFNNILIAESAGVSEYYALTLQLTRRFSRGFLFSANYTLSKATDDAPEQNLSTGVAFQNLQLTDPYNRSLDKGRSFADQRHTFVMSLVARPQFNFENKRLRYIFSNNQVSIITTANSGETFNIVSTSDINSDGITGLDRPVGIRRNAGTTPPQFNVDLRYSRYFNFTERYRIEMFGEFTNIFNINSIISFTNVSVATNSNGELTAPLPDFRARHQSISQESRQFQLGFKFVF